MKNFVAIVLASLLALGPAQGRVQTAVPSPHVNAKLSGQLTLPATSRGRYRFTEDGDKLIVVRPPNTPITAPKVLPRNVVALSSEAETTTIVLRAGTQVQATRARGALAFKFFDPVNGAGGDTAAPPVPQPSPAPDARARSDAMQPKAVADAPVLPAPQAAPPNRSGAAPTTGQAAILPVNGMSGPAILLPAAADVGLAAFQSASEFVIVLDAPIDLGIAPSNSPFARLVSQKTTDTTVVRVPAPDLKSLRVQRVAQGWIVVADSRSEALSAIVPTPVDFAAGNATLRFPVSTPGRVVSIRDPEAGTVLLVGTQGQAGEAMLSRQENRHYRLLPTLQGIVVSPRSDDVTLRCQPDAFVLTAGSPSGDVATADRTQQLADPSARAGEPRAFELPNGPLPALLDQVRARERGVSQAPALARTAPRLHLAEALVTLGLGAEAQAVLETAAAADPALAHDPYATALGAVAAILAGRLDEGSAILDPTLGQSPEITLWRTLLQVARGVPTAEDVNALAAELPLLLAYPAPLQEKLLPRAVEAMAVNGQAAAASRVLDSLPDRRDLDLARAMASDAMGQSGRALERYDQVAGGPDRLARYTAAVRAIELRLRTGALKPGQAADALEQQLMRWREAPQEVPLRIRIAALRSQAGQWRDALTMLREGATAYPDDKAPVDAAAQQTVVDFVSSDAVQNLPKPELAAICDENAATMQSISWPLALGLKLVDRLSELDLPGRAEAIMASLIAKTSDPVLRAGLGLRLAGLRLDMNDPAGAIAALDETAPAADVPLDPATVANRQIVNAKAEARRGNTPAALDMLQSLDTAEADEARAAIYSEVKDWDHLVSALSALEQKRGLQPGNLGPNQQALIMRLASAAALAGDNATLVRLRTTYGPSMAAGAAADRFRVITSDPIRGSNDLPRAFEEIQIARKLTAQSQP